MSDDRINIPALAGPFNFEVMEVRPRSATLTFKTLADACAFINATGMAYDARIETTYPSFHAPVNVRIPLNANIILERPGLSRIIDELHGYSSWSPEERAEYDAMYDRD